MASRSFELREFFHLTLLRHLGSRLSGRSYAVKGGICLRFFHRSPRLSEDMDIDVVSNVRAETLEKAVDSVIGGGAMLAALMPQGILRLTATKPKQTGTTQRWKVALTLSGGAGLPTKVEFSRRLDRIEYSTGVPDPELLRRYKMPPFAAQYYDAASMAAQKISALASPARNALRDLFDLHHLLFTLRVDARQAVAGLPAGVVEQAVEKTRGFDSRDFKEQVLPYLPGELIDLYRDPAVFPRQKDEVEQALREMRR